MIRNTFLNQRGICRLLLLSICLCSLALMQLWAAISVVYAGSDQPVNSIPTYFLAPFFSNPENPTDSAPSITLSRRSQTDANVQIIYRDFEPQSQLSLSLYQIQGYTSTIMKLPVQEIQIGKAGKYRQPLTALLGAEPDQIEPGQYLLLGCYSAECIKAPSQEIGSMDWPRYFSSLIEIGMNSTISHQADPIVNIVQVGMNSAASYVTNGLVFQVETLDPAHEYSLNSGIDSVELALLDAHGEVIKHNTSAVAPYCLFGSKRGACKSGALPKPGVYTLQAIAQTRDNRTGTITKMIWVDDAVDEALDESSDGVVTADPVETAQVFYTTLDQGIHTDSLQNAYNLLSEQQRSTKTLAEFETDFAETYAVVVEKAELVNLAEQQAVVHVVTIQVDKVDGQLASVRYDVICRLTKESDVWRVDKIYTTRL